ncbi:MAG: AAA family ATPase [Anaerolineales bacterium]|nr:AAA family ATPase [Anaerolineales bacterium]
MENQHPSDRPDLIKTMAGYVPWLITRRIAVDPTPIDQPRTERLPAAVLFADISGFTALTERLAQQGPAGAEALTRILNDYFGHLIDLIATHGGDVVKFAGDALIALFPALDEAGQPQPARLAQVTRLAAQCSVTAQQHLNNYQATEGIRLSLKLAIGAGEVITMHLGGVLDRWEFLVTGDPLTQVGQAEGCAQPGDIVISPEAWPLMADVAAGRAVTAAASGRVMRLTGLRQLISPVSLADVTLSAGTAAALRCYIPGAIRARLGANQSGWIAELRRVTVLFVNLPDLNYAIDLAQAQQVIRDLQDDLYRYEGSLNKLSVDDKGVTLVAAMGLPPFAHEDDADRAIKAALAMQRTLRTRGLRGGIGITTGRAFCGSVGNDRRREYTMIGDVVNLSARLMQAVLKQGIDDDILCDSVTYRATRASAALELMLGVDLDDSGGVGDVNDFEELPPITVKGKSQPIPIYRPIDRQTTVVDIEAFHAEMVGRAAERQLLVEKLKAVLHDDEGSLIIIEGEAGIGKSRLVEFVVKQTQTLALNYLIGAGNAIERTTPYHAWRPIFKQLFKLDTDLEPAAKRRQVLARLEADFDSVRDQLQQHIKAADADELLGEGKNLTEAPSWPQLAPLLDPVLPLDWPESELTEQMTGKVRADNTFELLSLLLQQVAHQANAIEAPYVFVLEDCHWLDSTSWQLAMLVAQRVEPVVLVLATRPLSQSAPSEYRTINQLPSTIRLVLDNLSPQDVIALICQRLAVDLLPPELTELIVDKAHGNPFFSEELVYALRDAGVIQSRNGTCHIAGDLAQAQLPDTVQGVVTSRIDRLTPAQQLTLKVASVIGRIFEFQLLHDVHPIEADRDDLPDHLDRLEALDIMLMETPEPGLAYIFKHIITQEVAYDLMLYAQRQALHRAVAQWCETVYAGDLSPYYGLLAHHWHRADQADRAIDYLEKAGEAALHDYANEEAIKFFSRAIALADQAQTASEGQNGRPSAFPATRRGHWEIKLGEAYVNAVRFKEGQIHLEQGLALLGYPAPTGNFQLGRGLIAQLWRRLRYSLRLPQRRLKSDHPRTVNGIKLSPPAPPEGGEKSQIPPSGGLGGPESATNLSPLPRTVLLEAARAYEGLTAVYYFANKPVTILFAALLSLNLAETAGPSPELARGYALVGVIIGFVPIHRLAEAYCRKALKMARALDNLSARAWVFLLTGIYHAGVGHWSRAQNLLEQVIDIAERLGDRSRWDDGVGNLAMIHFFRGDFERCDRLHADVLASAERRRDTHNQAWAMRGKVYVHLRRGEFDPALAALDTLQSLLRQDQQLVDEALTIDLHGMLAVVHLRRAEIEPALAAAKTGAALIAKASPSSFLSLPGYAGIAETYLSLWEREMVDRLGFEMQTINLSQIQKGRIRGYKSPYKNAARRACRALRKYAKVFPIGQPRANLWQGRFEWLSGRLLLAGELWRRSLALAEQYQMPYDQGLAHYEIGRHLPLDDPIRTQHLLQAERLFLDLGATYDFERVREALEESQG